MKKYHYPYLSKGRYLFILFASFLVLLIFTFLLIGIIKPSINWSIFILFSAPVLFAFIFPFLTRNKVEIKSLVIAENGIQNDDHEIKWEQIKWYRFDCHIKSDYEKIVILTSDKRYRIHYFDTKSHREEWKKLKSDLIIAIEENCPDLEKSKLY